MVEDSVLKEVRRAREAYAQRHNFDVKKIVADLQALDTVGDWPVVSFASGAEERAPAETTAAVEVTGTPS